MPNLISISLPKDNSSKCDFLFNSHFKKEKIKPNKFLETILEIELTKNKTTICQKLDCEDSRKI